VPEARRVERDDGLTSDSDGDMMSEMVIYGFMCLLVNDIEDSRICERRRGARAGYDWVYREAGPVLGGARFYRRTSETWHPTKASRGFE
jgi:hypothetical protein